MKKSSVAILALASLSVASYVGGVYGLVVLVQHVPRLGPFVFVDTHGGSTFDLRSAALQPGALMAVLALCLAFEAACIGVDNSSLKRLLAGSSASTRVDLFYIVLRLSGAINVLAFVFSFGMLFWLANQIHHLLHMGNPLRACPYAIQFLIVYLVNTFLAYWGHRFMHTRMMWEIHKVHHAAEEMNVVTPFRNHPIDHVVMSLLNAFPVAILGAAPAVVIVYYAINMVYQSLVHSEIRLKGTLWNKIWITPAAHRVHHSNRVEHWNTNFGIITLWDYVFGTYHTPTDEKLTYGVDGGEQFNRPRYLLELFDNVRRWLRPMWKGRAPSRAAAPSAPAPKERIPASPVGSAVAVPEFAVAMKAAE